MISFENEKRPDIHFNISVAPLVRETTEWLKSVNEHLDFNCWDSDLERLNFDDIAVDKYQYHHLSAGMTIRQRVDKLVHAMCRAAISSNFNSITAWEANEWYHILEPMISLPKDFYADASMTAKENIDAEGPLSSTINVKEDFITFSIDPLIAKYSEFFDLVFKGTSNRILTTELKSSTLFIVLGEDFRIASYKSNGGKVRWNGEPWEL